MITFTAPDTKLIYGMCYDATHLHRDTAEGYEICDNTAQYWPVTEQAIVYEEAVTMATVTGSVGATARHVRVDRDGTEIVTAECVYKRPRHRAARI